MSLLILHGLRNHRPRINYRRYVRVYAAKNPVVRIVYDFSAAANNVVDLLIYRFIYVTAIILISTKNIPGHYLSLSFIFSLILFTLVAYTMILQ